MTRRALADSLLVEVAYIPDEHVRFLDVRGAKTSEYQADKPSQGGLCVHSPKCIEPSSPELRAKRVEPDML